MNSIDDLAALVARHAPGDGIHELPVPGVGLVRSDDLTQPVLTLQQPALCIIAQGAKQVMLGDRTYRYDVSTNLVVSVDLPVAGQVIEASAEHPYLAIRIDLDATLLNELMLDDVAPPPGESISGLTLSPIVPELIDASARLLRLLDRPADIPALAPLIRREIHYRLLAGEQAAAVRHIAATEGKLAQVSRAIAWIKANFHQPFSLDTVAREARMSPSALHQHFKAVTAMSPLQYQKHLRLHEARRLMVGLERDAQAAGFDVGYESPSQFTREYARLFGAPPARDAARLRADNIGAVPV